MSKRLIEKALLINWEGADWDIVKELLDKGSLPVLAHFLEKGVFGRLANVKPLVPAVLNTSLATGKRPDKHGVLDDVEIMPGGTGVRPVTRNSLRARPLWDILSDHGIRCTTVNWCATHPAYGQSSTVITDLFKESLGVHYVNWPPLPGMVHPESLRTVLKDLRVHREDLDGGQVRFFIPDLSSDDSPDSPTISGLTTRIAECSTVHAVGTFFAEQESWDLLSVRYDAFPHINRGFLRFRLPRQERTEKDLPERFSAVVDRSYQFFDLMLGRYLQLVGESTTVFVVSPYGVKHRPSPGIAPLPDADAPDDPREYAPTEYGFFAARGPCLKKDDLVFGASLLDPVPTLLTLFGVPVGKDMDGSVLTRALTAPATPAYVPTHERPAANVTVTDGPSSEDVDMAIRRLCDEGYENFPVPAHLLQDVRDARKRRLLNLAEVHMSFREHQNAVKFLEELLSIDPRHLMGRVRLVQCELELGRIDAGRRHWEALQKENPELPWTSYLEGEILFAEGDAGGALRAFQKAKHGDSPEIPNLLLRIGATLLKRNYWAEAEETFRGIIKAEPEHPFAYDGLGVALVQQRRFREAVDALRTSVGVAYQQPATFFHLAQAFAGAGDREEALQAVGKALELDPSFREARAFFLHLAKAS